MGLFAPVPSGHAENGPASNRLFKQLLLSYDLDVAVAGRTTIRVPLISDVIYESMYDSQLIQVFNSRQQYVGATDFHTSPIALAKGKHTVLVQVRHEDEAVLQGLVDMSPSLAVSRALARPVSVPIYSEFQGGGRAQKMLKLGDTDTVYVNAPALSSDAGDGLDDCGDGLDDCGDGEVAEGVGEPPAAFDKVTFWATHILSIDPPAPHKPYTSIVASPVAVQGMSLLVAFDPPELAFVVPALILSPRPPV